MERENKEDKLSRTGRLPVLEIAKRGKRAWRTKDIWEDQKT